MVLSSITWSGLGGDNNWSTAANWVGNAAPGANDDVVFDNTGTKNSTDDLSQVRSVAVNAGYTGTITLSTNLTVPGGLSQSSGTIVTGTNTLTSGKSFTVASPGTFTANGGTVVFNAPMNYGPGTVDASGVQFNNMTIDYGSNHFTVGTSGPLHVNGTLNIKGINQLLGNDIDAAGDVTSSSPMSINPSNYSIVLDGSGPQSLSGTSSDGYVPNVVINKPNANNANKVTVTGGITTRNWADTKGAVDASASTVTFIANPTINPNGMTFGSVNINAGSNHVYLPTQLVVGGDLTINSLQDFIVTNVASNPIVVQGSLTSNKPTFTNVGSNSTLAIVLNGGGNVSITGGAFPGGGITINKASNSTVTASVTTPLAGPLNLVKVNQLNGTFKVAGNVTTSMASGTTDGYGTGGSVALPGTVLEFAGSSPQTLTSTIAGGSVPGVLIDNGSTVNISASGANSLAVTGDWINNGTVSAAGSNVVFRKGWFGGNKTVTVNDGGNHFSNLTIQEGGGDTIVPTALNVDGLLTIAQIKSIGGTINAYGNVTTTDTQVYGGGTINFAGTGAQTLSAGANNAQVPNVTIAKTGGSFTLDNNGNTIGVTGSAWTNSSTGTTFNTGGSSVSFVADPAGGIGRTVTVNDGGKAFGDVIINEGGNDKLAAANANTALNVGGNFTITRVGSITGTINAYGDVTSTQTSAIGGGGAIKMTELPGVYTTVSITGGAFPSGGITINKSGSTLSNVNANVSTALAGPLNLVKLWSLNGTFTVGGGVTTNFTHISGIGTGASAQYPGTVLVFGGTAQQTLKSTVPNGEIPGVQINAGSKVAIDTSGDNGPPNYVSNSLNVTGDWINNGGTVNAAGSNVGFKKETGGGSTAITINDGGQAFGNLVIARGNSSDKTIVASLHTTGYLTLTSSTLDFGANVVTVGGGMSVSSTSTLRFAPTSATAQLAVTGNLTFSSGSSIAVVGTPPHGFNLITVIGTLANYGVTKSAPGGYTLTVNTNYPAAGGSVYLS